MTKEVLLAIRGLQIAEDEQKDTVETISPENIIFVMGSTFSSMKMSKKDRQRLQRIS